MDKNGKWFGENMARMQDEFAKFVELKSKVKPRVEALKIILIYMVLGILWILLSDKIVETFVKNVDVVRELQLYKGWFYVFFTGGIFYKIIKRKLKLYEKSIDTILESYDVLSTAHEELMAMNEELYQQNNELEKQRNEIIVSEQRYELAVQGSTEGIWDWDIKKGVYYFSIEWKGVLGYDENELNKTIETWRDLLHPDDRIEANNILDQYLESKGGVYECTYRLRCKDGKYRWILSRGKGVWDKEGHPVRIAGSHTDITEQMQLEESLRSEKELSRSIIYEAKMLIVVFNKEGRIIQFNPYAEKIIGFKKEEILGKKSLQVLVSNDDDQNKIFQEILRGENLSSRETDIRCKNGDYVTILWDNILLHDLQGNIQGVISIGINITERREMEDKLHMMAYFDTLTGLPNRAFFEQEVKNAICKLDQSNQKAALIYIDIDDFKNINDTMGHVVGDYLIQHVRDILLEHFHLPHVIARLGGDEFAILLNNIQNESYIIPKIEIFMEKLRKPWLFEGKSYYISVSMGVAIYPDHGTNYSILMQNADTAMFYIKDKGKDNFVIFESSMFKKTLKYIEMSNQLRIAIEKQEFLLYYQPQFDLTTGKIIGVEALIRWNHPIRGLIPPIEFIPLAEKTGHIVQIDEWVLKTACRQKRSWEKKGYSPIKISVNISSHMITESRLVTEVQDLIQDYKINPREIEIEVTETVVMVEFDKAIKVLQSLKDLGISIALDDFGTGYSSLTYLQTLPFDILKIDRDFLKNVENGNEEIYIFRAIVDLAHNMGLKVVAEGVETKEQIEYLHKNNCDFAQGYYFSRPIPASELELLLLKNLETST